MSQLYIGTIIESEYEIAKEVVREAFLNAEHTDGNEHELIGKIRKTKNYNSNLEVVAKLESNRILGHAMMSEVEVRDKDKSSTILALAPVSVLPNYQNRGIGKAMIKALEDRAYEDGYEGVVVLGHAKYYKKLGYEVASKFDIRPPFEALDDNFMFKYLWEHPTKNIKGTVHYPESFQ